MCTSLAAAAAEDVTARWKSVKISDLRRKHRGWPTVSLFSQRGDSLSPLLFFFFLPSPRGTGIRFHLYCFTASYGSPDAISTDEPRARARGKMEVTFSSIDTKTEN